MSVATYEMSHASGSRAPSSSSPVASMATKMSTSLRLTHRPQSTTPPSPIVRISRHRPRPIPNSYWATPYLVACEFPYCPLTPAQMTRKHTKQKLDALLLAGVRTFIDLTEPHELFPYHPHLTERCTVVGLDPREVEYYNFPIRDRSLPDSVDLVRRVMGVLRDNEERGRISAVHCRGGIGRTGLIVGCWLVECGIAKDGDDALRMIAEEWKNVEKCKRYPLSPETGPQHEYVRTFERAAWIDEKHEVL